MMTILKWYSIVLFKILAIKKKKSMQELLKEYVKKEIEEEKKNEKEKQN